MEAIDGAPRPPEASISFPARARLPSVARAW